jgi:hypothetical protein
MHWVFAERFSIDQATWIRLVTWVVLNNLTLKDADKDFVECEMVGLSLFIGVVCNPYAIMAYGVNDVFQIHSVLPLIDDVSCHFRV